uniref:Uncharacterized protein n=1 Tax=Panagrolaimus sp. ES5 TaxID=591445 RepID=A0AC34FXP3_9BILA
MVQAMKAEDDDEKDRRNIWEDNRSTPLDLVQCFCVVQLEHESIKQKAVSEQSIISKTSSAPGPSGCHIEKFSAASFSEYSYRIGELTVLAKNSLAAKEQVSQQMVIMNSEVDGRQKSLAARIEQLEKRTKQLNDEFKAALDAEDNK